MESICFILKTNYLQFFFYFKIFHHDSKAGLFSLWGTGKIPFDVICCLYKMKQYYWFLCVAKVIGPAKLHTVKLDLNGFSCNKKNFSENANPRILQFLSSEQPCEPKSLDVALNTAGVERIRSENLRLRSTLKATRFAF